MSLISGVHCLQIFNVFTIHIPIVQQTVRGFQSFKIFFFRVDRTNSVLKERSGYLPKAMRNAARHSPSSGSNRYETSRCQAAANRLATFLLDCVFSATTVSASASASMARMRTNERETAR